MRASELGIFLGRINDATEVPQLTAMLDELERDPDRAAADRLVALIAARSNTLAGRNQ